MRALRWAAQNLAALLLATGWTQRELAQQVRAFCGPQAPLKQGQLIDQLVALDDDIYSWSRDRLGTWLSNNENFQQACAYFRHHPEDVPIAFAHPEFRPAPAFAECKIPRLVGSCDLAVWLGLTVPELDWFADANCQHQRAAIPDLQHYTYRLVPKRNGAVRLIEAPKPRMKTIQRKILREILDHVPVHADAHGFVTARSCLTAAQKHAGEAIVITADLRDFFPRTRVSRVHRLFRSLGYPEDVARILTRLCSTVTPRAAFARLPRAERPCHRTRQIYETRHLPQGAPTSPALANLAAYGLDVRLSGLARSFEGNYTRYADDLAFSGGSRIAGRSRAFLRAVERIAVDTGYHLQSAKTHVMPRSQKQRITGIVVNDHVNVARKDFDALKATLCNCIRHGPATQNRENHQDYRAHLHGRVMWVEQVNPMRGEKLRSLFERINW